MVHGRQMVQMVDLWEVYLKLEGRATGLLLNLAVYILFFCLLMAVIYRMPSAGARSFWFEARSPVLPSVDHVRLLRIEFDVWTLYLRRDAA